MFLIANFSFSLKRVRDRNGGSGQWIFNIRFDQLTQKTKAKGSSTASWREVMPSTPQDNQRSNGAYVIKVVLEILSKNTEQLKN